MAAHLMTQACIEADATVYLDYGSDNNAFWICDLTQISTEEIDDTLRDCRESFSHRVMDVSRGQFVGLVLFCLPEGCTRIVFDVDLLLCDVNGFQGLLNQLGWLYSDPTIQAPHLAWGPSSTGQGHANVLEKATLVDAYPYGSGAEKLSGCRYRSFDTLFEQLRITVLESCFKKHRATLFSGILACLLKTCDITSENDLVVNVPWFTAPADGEEFVRDLTESLWLTVHSPNDVEIFGLARQLDRQLEEQRHIPDRVQYKTQDALVPLVYSFNQNGVFIDQTTRDVFGDLIYMISQTPNVCLDVQLFRVPDGLLVSWVYPADIQGSEAIHQWFERFVKLVTNLGTDI